MFSFFPSYSVRLHNVSYYIELDWALSFHHLRVKSLTNIKIFFHAPSHILKNTQKLVGTHWIYRIWSGDGTSPEKMLGCHENSFQQRLRSSNVLGCIWRIIIKPCTFKYFSVDHDHDIVDLYNLFVFIHVFDEGFVENEGSQIFMVHHHFPPLNFWIVGTV